MKVRPIHLSPTWRAAGFAPEGTVVDHEWGGALHVRGPGGTAVQIDERDPDPYT